MICVSSVVYFLDVLTEISKNKKGNGLRSFSSSTVPIKYQFYQELVLPLPSISSVKK